MAICQNLLHIDQVAMQGFYYRHGSEKAASAGCANAEKTPRAYRREARPEPGGALIHQSAWCVRMNSSPLLGTIEELLRSPSALTAITSNCGLALKTKQSPP
jgi:hypothetical protein